MRSLWFYLKLETQKYDNVDWVYDVESAGIDGDQDLGVVVYNQWRQWSGRRLDLSVEKSATVVGEGPTELQVLPHQSFGWSIAWYRLQRVTLYDLLLSQVKFKYDLKWDSFVSLLVIQQAD